MQQRHRRGGESTASPPLAVAQKAEFPLAEGIARLEFPSSLSPESYEDLEAWLELVLRRAKRSVEPPSAEDRTKGVNFD